MGAREFEKKFSKGIQMKNIILASIVLISTNSFAYLTPMPMPIPAAKKIFIEPVLVTEIKQHANLMPGPGPARPIDTSLQVNVISTGCTKDSDFEVNVITAGTDQLINIVRVNPDPCDDEAKTITVKIDTTKLALSSSLPIRVANPLLVEELVTH
jgi:hypothetical protein